ncbi:MAG: plasmid stability protein [Acidobacteria bacterium]|nr:MAG: plasmid stability protein [Acidobacteriota bacterium]
MATLTIKNVPEKLHKRLKQSAAQHRRSVNSEAIACLERTLLSTRIDPEEFLARARALRERTPNLYVTADDLRKAKNEGRL